MQFDNASEGDMKVTTIGNRAMYYVTAVASLLAFWALIAAAEAFARG